MTAFLESHKRAKDAIVAHYRELAKLAQELGMTTLASDLTVSRIPKIENERFHLVVLGEFNHGKSTFVNALLGDEVLPVGITPTTSVINHVVYADEPSISAKLSTGETRQLAPEQLSDWVTVAGHHSAEVKLVEVGYPAELLKENITLVDTPGVNDLNEQRAEITYGYVPRADAVIFLLDAAQALKDSEREFLSSHVLKGSLDRLIFVLGKTDLLSAAELQAVTDYVREGLSKLVDQPKLFSISAKSWLDGDREGSGVPELIEYLGRFLDTDRAQIIVDNAAVDAGRTAAYLQQNLILKSHAFELDIGELEQRVESVRKQLNASKRMLDDLHVRIVADAAAVKSQAKLDLETFARRFVEVLPEQLDSVDADELKRYLGPFIQDKFKEWAELEGAKVASLLEKLAEDVIAVTNENLAAAGAALASRLRPADTEVEIDIDSFKYDVGVYALGALGTAVWVFVGNLLAGGLLTLAAPILAIVVRSKVSGDIREQAKERVPPVILRAADAMGPHFDRCIDDFTDRLRDFVTSAGNSLYKGISEILDQTISERKASEAQVETLRQGTMVQNQRVSQIRQELEQVRSTLWSAPGPDVSAAESE